MNRRLRLVSIGIASLAIVGCASARLHVTRPLLAPERQVALRMQGAPEAQFSEDQRMRYQSLLTSRLSEKGISVVAGRSDTDTANGTITRYNPGSRALRYLIGFGAGRGTLDSQWDVVDQKGEVLGACRIDGSIAMGIFGGSFDDVLEKSADRLAEFLSGGGR